MIYRITSNLLALHDPNRKKANSVINTSENIYPKALSTTDLDKSLFIPNSEYSKKPSSLSKNLAIEDPHKNDHRYTNANNNKYSILKDNKDIKDYNPAKDIKSISKKK